MTEPVRLNPSQRVERTPTAGSAPASKISSGSPEFAEVLSKAQANNLSFSNHAQKRIEKRDITLTDDSMARLINAVNKAENRGGKESLVLMDDVAFIVNVRDRKVVTALDVKQRGEGVFTQIDSVVLADSEDTE